MKAERGFTLVELLTAVMIASIILTLAVPSFLDTIRDNRVLTAANGMIVAVNTARAESVRRGRNITICPSSDAATCSTTDWAKGWIVVVDKAAAVTDKPDVDTDNGGVLQVGGEMKAVAVTKTAGTNDWLRFSPRGLLLGEAAGVTLELKPETCKAGKAYRILSIGVAGRASTTKSTCT